MGCRIAVFGTGYLGATHAACMAALGHDVVGVDVDIDKLARLSAGEAPFFEPDLDDVLKANIGAGRLRFTSSYAEAVDFADVHFIGVATPQKRGEFAADLTYVDSVVSTLAPMLTRPTVIFGKSTVPVGTAARLSDMAQDLAPVGDAVEVAWNPEFLREGHAVQDTLHPDRIVVGVDMGRDGRAEEVAREMYSENIAEGVPFLVTDRETSGACEDGRECVSGHEDFVHQCHGGAMRIRRRRCYEVGRRNWLRRQDRPPVSKCRDWIWRGLSAEGYPRLYGSGR